MGYFRLLFPCAIQTQASIGVITTDLGQNKIGSSDQIPVSIMDSYVHPTESQQRRGTFRFSKLYLSLSLLQIISVLSYDFPYRNSAF
jgi:hypothetical protein